MRAPQVLNAWHDLTQAPRARAYVRALRAANHADGKLPEIESLAHARLRDEHGWDVYAALAALGLHSTKGAPEMRSHPADFGPDVYTIRSSALRELLLRVPPPIGLKGLVASYADANKLCFKLSITQVNGRVGLQDALRALLTAKLTAGDDPSTPTTSDGSDSDLGHHHHDTNVPAFGIGPSSNLPPPKLQQPLLGARATFGADGGGGGGGGAEESTAVLFAKDAINARLKQRRLVLGGRAGEQLEAQRAMRRRTVLARKNREGVPEHAWESVTNGVFFPIAPLKQRCGSPSRLAPTPRPDLDPIPSPPPPTDPPPCPQP